MFSRGSIFSLIDILFKDMNEDHKIFEQFDEEEEDYGAEEVPEEQSQAKETAKEEDSDDGKEEDEMNYEDLQKLGVDVEGYLSNKAVLTIERIKDIVGEIMSSCQKKMKYNILENIIKGVIFENKKLRESFMQEILNAADNATFRNNLEQYLNRQQMVIPEDGEFQTYERIIEISRVDINNTLSGFTRNPTYSGPEF